MQMVILWHKDTDACNFSDKDIHQVDGNLQCYQRKTPEHCTAVVEDFLVAIRHYTMPLVSRRTESSEGC